MQGDGVKYLTTGTTPASSFSALTGIGISIITANATAAVYSQTYGSYAVDGAFLLYARELWDGNNTALQNGGGNFINVAAPDGGNGYFSGNLLSGVGKLFHEYGGVHSVIGTNNTMGTPSLSAMPIGAFSPASSGGLGGASWPYCIKFSANHFPLIEAESVILAAASETARAAFPPVPFTPSVIPGMQLWLSVDSIIGLGDGDPVYSWNDSSVIGNNFSAPGFPPLYSASGMNGLPAVAFGSNNYLTGPTIASNPLTVLVVARLDDMAPVIDSVNMMIGGTSSGFYWYWPGVTGAPNWYDGSGDTRATNSSSVGPAVLSVTANGSTSSHLYRNDGIEFPSYALTSFGPNALDSVTTWVGASWSDPSFKFRGWISEILVYDTALSPTNIAKLHNYFRLKYGI